MDNNQLITSLRFALNRIATNTPHRHHSDCIHNLPADEQITLRGKDRDWWEAMGLPEPVVITPADWEIESPLGPPKQTTS